VIELFTFWLAGFCTGVAFTGGLAGWFRLRMGPPRGSYGPRQPEQPLAADLIRYSRWRSEQIERALRDEPPTPN
jgi:hypothetical protein